MVHNVEQILSRGERIELLVDKTDTMAGQSLAFRRGAKAARRKMFWRNQKILALGVVVALVSASLWNTHTVLTQACSSLCTCSQLNSAVPRSISVVAARNLDTRYSLHYGHGHPLLDLYPYVPPI